MLNEMFASSVVGLGVGAGANVLLRFCVRNEYYARGASRLRLSKLDILSPQNNAEQFHSKHLNEPSTPT